MCENALSHWSHWYGFSPVRIDWFGLNELYSRHQLQYRVQVYISSSLNMYWHFPFRDNVQVWVTIMCKHLWKHYHIGCVDMSFLQYKSILMVFFNIEMDFNQDIDCSTAYYNMAHIFLKEDNIQYIATSRRYSISVRCLQDTDVCDCVVQFIKW